MMGECLSSSSSLSVHEWPFKGLSIASLQQCACTDTLALKQAIACLCKPNQCPLLCAEQQNSPERCISRGHCL